MTDDGDVVGEYDGEDIVWYNSKFYKEHLKRKKAINDDKEDDKEEEVDDVEGDKEEVVNSEKGEDKKKSITEVKEAVQSGGEFIKNVMVTFF